MVATKGFKTSGTDDITYGYIFDNCEFTADTSAMAEAGTADNYVNDGTVSIARAWGDSMSIAVINSSISSAYSTEYYGNTSSNKNDRYGIMSASYSLKPSALIEYNNTGAGAVYASAEAAAAAQNTDEGVDTYTADTTTYTVYDSTTYAETFTLLTDATDAAVYSTLATIFAAENGSMTYSEGWSGTYDATRWTISIYDGDGTKKLGEIVVTDGGTTAASDILATISSALEDGYTLDGVYTDADCSTAYDYAAVTADVTLYITTKAKDTSSVSYNVVVDDYTSDTYLTSSNVATKDTTVYFNADGSTTTTASATTGIVSFTGGSSGEIASNKITYDNVDYSNYIKINGGSSTGNGRYFAIDISGLEGYTLSITIVMTAGGSSDRYAFVYSGGSVPSTAITDMTTSGVEGYATSSSTSTVGGNTITYAVTSSSPDTLYVLASAGIRIYAALVTVAQS
ncbi:MAG: hypothetical protein LUD27_07315 [Clostridia bacterium]|nr:hypothetical protein [Clostridia bacterium]